MISPRPVVLPVLLLGVTLLAACDSGDPIETTTPEEVAGSYQFVDFTFQPDAEAIAPLNLLDTLNTVQTALLLSGDGNFILQYRFQGGVPFYTTGTFKVTEQTVRLDGADSSGDTFRKILLDRGLVLRREEVGTLTYEADKSVNLEPFGPRRYAGLTSVPGTLRLRLVAE